MYSSIRAAMSSSRGATRYRHPTNGRAIRRSPAGPLDSTRFAPVEAARSSLPAAFQKENTILTDGVSFCDCPQVLLFVRLAYRKSKKRNEARLATGIPRMAEPFAGTLPDLLIQRASRRSRQRVQACPRHSKKKHHPDGWCFFLERATRLELATSTLARSRSTR